jgi:hypothetical protein
MLASRLGFWFMKRMQRLIARFLLLFALAGIFLPAALQATAAPSHMCCRRTAQHHCHSFALTDPGQAAVHGPGCSQGCRRAVATSQCAHLEPSRFESLLEELAINASDFQRSFVSSEFSSSESTRAPPRTSIA